MTRLLTCCLLWIVVSCSDSEKQFRLHTTSGIEFTNQIDENDSINVIDFENVYNGGGVAIADFNQDGWQDVYFTGNLVSNKLYLNQGNFKFTDVTTAAGVTGDGRWCRGVTTVDINNDGLLDMYVSASAKRSAPDRRNLLYVNQGNQNGVPIFMELAREYGLDDTSHSTMAAFFDYDNDGDLDLFIATNEIIPDDYPNRFRPILADGSHPSTDKLYRNDWNHVFQHPVFTDVSKEAGILLEGYSHNVTISDFNRDGWQDIYVTNDYLSCNILYINNRNGTFSDEVRNYFKHTSANAMGSDVIDLNNDGWQDVIELDMNPEDNFRKKMMLNPNSYQTYQNLEHFDYHYQYVRNTVQINQGRAVRNDSIIHPVFSDVAYFSGMAETDWSWSPVVADFDNDGWRDVIITNGFPRDVTDHDFVTFRNEAYAVASKQQLLEQIPAVKIHNYAYRNNGDLTFENVTKKWGFETPSFSNGAAYGDLDNDGDLDVVINNINDKSFVYENRAMQSSTTPGFLRIHLRGDSLNLQGIGAWIEVHHKNTKQVYEHTPVRGYLSSIQPDAHFGLGTISEVDSVVVVWPDKKRQVIKNVKANQILNIDKKDAVSFSDTEVQSSSIFKEVTLSSGVEFFHKETDFIDFNIQKLLPHKFSEYGPALAVGDLDGNQLDDLILGGSFGNSARLFLQQPNGQFIQRDLIKDASLLNKRWEDLGIVVFDAEGDGDNDIYIASGGYENPAQTDTYQDRMYVNDGMGNFIIDTTAIPRNYTSKSCVRAADFDKDGDLDLFVGGRVEPWQYPKPVSSVIYRNDSRAGRITFSDITSSAAPQLQNVGLICDALWTDYDSDGWQDLLLAGEWLTPTLLRNVGGKLSIVPTNMSGLKGWWQSILPGDFDNDGDMDYVMGNLGRNSYYKAKSGFPVRMYAKDFDNNGNLDAVSTLYLPATLENPEMKEFPAQTRDDMVKQMIAFRSKFQNYRSYASVTFDKMFSKEELKNAILLEASTFDHMLLLNEGNGNFKSIALPAATQLSCINGMVAEDFDGDGNLDILINGNDYGTEVSVGRYNACNGLMLRGDGKGGFTALSILQSGIYIPGNGKALVKLRDGQGSYLVAASQNRGATKLFQLKQDVRLASPKNGEVAANITLKSGKIRRHEFGFGNSFLSQSGKFFILPDDVATVEFVSSNGEKRIARED